MIGKKILFTDLDGTLLKDDKSVSAEDRASINDMISEGHPFVIATGRPLYSAMIVADSLGLLKDGVYIAASNGGGIYDCSKKAVIKEVSVGFESVELLFMAADEAGIHVQTYTDTHVVSLRETEELKIYSETTKMPYEILDNIPGELKKQPPKVILMSIKENSRAILERFEKSFAAKLNGELISMFSSDWLLEYLPPDATKGNAVRKLCSICGIRIEDSVAVGDEANDISMIDAAGTGAVMLNGTDSTKQHADYITARTNNESGVSEVIRKFILNN